MDRLKITWETGQFVGAQVLPISFWYNFAVKGTRKPIVYANKPPNGKSIYV